ncbi:MAG: DUF4114 domain-containing protein [Phycisphaerales bacterium]|nr:hypothetical protein [Planctomycetota bacterium]MCH8507435.1 DUF4114 domain-containing protein [Phycisphaerales bacterium]
MNTTPARRLIVLPVPFSAAALLAIAAAGACGSIVADQGRAGVGTPVIVWEDHAVVTVEFLGSDAGYTGELLFRGAGPDEFGITTPVPEAGDGMVLFNNKTSTIGDTVTLPGVYRLGEVLHFGYMLLSPSRVAGQGFFTDLPGDHAQFLFDAPTGFFAVEDLRLPYSDEDYNDATFRITIASIPAPGVLIGFGALGLLGLRRSR